MVLLGICKWPNGKTYEGDFVDDQEHGQGTETLANGEEYVGGFRGGKRQGRGMLSKGDKQYDMQYELGKEVETQFQNHIFREPQ